MSLKAHNEFLKNTTKYLSLLVLLTSLCYPAYVFAVQSRESLADPSVSQVETVERVTIELAEVSELDKVASFTQLLAKNPRLSDLQLAQVQLQVDQPEHSFVRWTALLSSGTPGNLEQDLQSATVEFEGLKVVHRKSYRGFVAFALSTVAPSEDKDLDFFPASRRSAWPVRSGQGFD